MYKAINIDFPEAQEYFLDSDVDAGKKLDNLSRINIFIGPNNSGKSRFLRAAFNNNDLRYTPFDSRILEGINNKITRVVVDISKIFTKYGIKSINRLPAGGKKVEMIAPFIYIYFNTNELNNVIEFLKTINDVNIINRIEMEPNNYLSPAGRLEVMEGFKSIYNQYIDFFEKSSLKKIISIKRKNTYIPILRGLREINLQSNLSEHRDNYKERTIQDYFSKVENIEESVYTGLSLFNDVKRLLLGHAPDRKLMKDFEKFIGDTFFDGQQFTIIPHIEDNVVHVKIGESNDFPIYQLGEGIQTIIILTYPLFFNQGKDINFFFEEPDIHLHPGFQRIFLEALQRPEFSTFQYFMTTHSNHFLDMTLDFNAISVYTFKKESENRFLIRNMENSDRNVLEMLGIRNSSVFLTNCTIWVEGITDRMYIRKYLELMQKGNDKTFREDIHYSFVEYGGGNITHWSFLEDNDSERSNIDVEKLCGTLFLITDLDSETTKKNGEPSKKQLRQQKLQEKLQERYYCLEVREIENLLSEEVLKAVITEWEGDNADLINFDKIKFDNYKKKPLGKFIETLEHRTRKYAADSGTINQKIEFAKTAVKYIDSVEKMSEEAKDLTKKILEFIKTNNK